MSEPLRVLMITGEYPPMQGGVADYTSLLAHEMTAQGAQVQVLSSVRAMGNPSTQVVSLARVPRWDAACLYSQLERALAETRAQVVSIQYQTGAYDMRPAINLAPRIFRKVPFVVTFHDLREPYLFPKAGRVRRWVTHHLARSARAAIVTNPADYRQLQADSRVSRLELITIPSNIAVVDDPALTDEMRRRWALDEFDFVLGYFGLVNASKGVDDIISALALLRNEGLRVGLLLIGGGTGANDPTNAQTLQAVRQQIDRLGLTQAVCWTGFLTPEEVSAAMRCAHCGVFPFRDGVSLRRASMMAAMSHRLPVVSTTSPEPSDVIKDGENVLLVPPGRPAAIAKALVRLYDDHTLRDKLGEGGWQLTNQFRWPETARRTLEVLHGALES